MAMASASGSAASTVTTRPLRSTRSAGSTGSAGAQAEMASASARQGKGAARSGAGISPGVRYTSRVAILAAAALAAVLHGSCGLPLAFDARPLPIRDIEERYQQARALRDEIDVTRSRGADATAAGVPLAVV